MEDQPTFNIELPPEIAIRSLDDLRPLLEAALQHGQTKLCATAVIKADTAGLQMIASFLREAEFQSIYVAWDNPSSALRQAADTLGLDAELNLQSTLDYTQ